VFGNFLRESGFNPWSILYCMVPRSKCAITTIPVLVQAYEEVSLSAAAAIVISEQTLKHRLAN
jgi:hypothetical protein